MDETAVAVGTVTLHVPAGAVDRPGAARELVGQPVDHQLLAKRRIVVLAVLGAGLFLVWVLAAGAATSTSDPPARGRERAMP